MPSTDPEEMVPGDRCGGVPAGAPWHYCRASLLLLAALLVLPDHAGAQWAFRARLDNDAYNFWQQPARRTDQEYSNGVRVSAERYRSPWWARRLTSAAGDCEISAGSRKTCVSHELALGQEIYTPDLERAPYTVPDWELERPYAAWLYLSSTARFARPRTIDEVEIAAGVTGEPALGRLAHSLAHLINRRFTREARGWDTQVAFEPGVLARYRRSWLIRAAAERGAGAELQPFIGAAAGNILTNAEAGLLARIGFSMSHPWHVPSWEGRAAFELFVLGGVRQEAVARNFSLDGNLVRPQRSVERRPLVGEHSLGVGLRMGRVTLSWRAVSRGREYESGPKHHSVGVMQGGVEIQP